MKKLFTSLLIGFISCYSYSQGMFGINHANEEEPELPTIEEPREFEQEDYNDEGFEENEISEETQNTIDLLDDLDRLEFFSDAITRNIRLYKVNSQVANEKDDVERADFLYDSLVNNCLKGTHFDDFIVNKSNGDLIYFDSFNKPIYLKSTSSWCEPNASEAAAFNDVADEFSDLIDFVVLYWDPKFKMNQIEDKYSKNVTILYVDETENYSSAIVSSLKHSLGLPTVILMDQERKLIDVKRGANPEYVPEPREGLTRYGTFNPGTTKDHFVNSYGDYYDKLVIDVNTIISKM